MTIRFLLLLAFSLTAIADDMDALRERLAREPEAVRQALLAEPREDDPQWNLLLADACRRSRDPENGIPAARKAVAQLPESAPAHYFLAANLSAKMQKAPMSWMTGKKEYLELLERALALDPNYQPTYYELIGFHTQAPAFIGASKKKAHEYADRLIAVDVEAGLLLKATVYAAQKDLDAQLATLQRAAREVDETPDITHAVGMALAGAERYREAVLWLDKHPDHLLSRYQAARARILGGFELEEAVRLLDGYLADAGADARPGPVAAWWRKGNALEGLGDREAARAAYEQALVLDPEYEEALKSLAALK